MTQQPWGQPGGQQPGRPPAAPPAWGQQQQPAWGQQPPAAWGQQQPAWGQPAVQQRPQAYSQPTAPLPGQPSYPPQPPRSGSPLKLVLLGLVAVIAVGFFFISLMGYLNDDEVVGPGPQPSPEVTQGEEPPPPVEVPEPDMTPPKAPGPKTWEEADQWLVANAIYAETVQVPTACPVGRMDATTAGTAEMQEHLNELTRCLTMVWLEPMERAGFQMPRPPATVFDQPITTACGDTQSGDIFYCSADQRIYYASDAANTFPESVSIATHNPFFLASVIGHEYGHAVQARTGILASQTAVRGQADEETNLELSRRKEMQADCFAGVFLNAIAQATQITEAEHAALPDVTYAVGDDIINEYPGYVGDHGTGAARQKWFEIGNASAQVAVCNTWTASADVVR